MLQGGWKNFPIATPNAALFYRNDLRALKPNFFKLFFSLYLYWVREYTLLPGAQGIIIAKPTGAPKGDEMLMGLNVVLLLVASWQPFHRQNSAANVP